MLAILGSGLVGRGTLATCDTVFAWEDVRLWSRTQESVDRYLAEEAPKYPHLTITGTTDVEEAVDRRGRDRHRHARARSGSSTTPG